MALPDSPINKTEQYLARIAGQDAEYPESPQTRVEQYLDYIAQTGGGSGGGSGGTTNYNLLTNKPSINGIQLNGNKASSDLGLASSSDFSQYKEETSAELNKKINKTAVGQANGVARLDSSGKIPSSQLPFSLDSSPTQDSKNAVQSGGTYTAIKNHYIEVGRKANTIRGAQSTAEGGSNTASGEASHAEGVNNTASGIASHAEGMNNTASNDSSHAEGDGTTASGEYSHSEGSDTTASGYSSHAEGEGTTAARKSQHVFGEYNVVNGTGTTKRGTYVEIVGNGTSASERSNARTLDWSGNETLAGKLTMNTPGTGTNDAVTHGQMDTALTGKQNTLTFDTAPTAGSTNPVTSGGVYSALAETAETAEELAENLADLNPPHTASGSVVTFTSAAAGNPINPMIVNIEPVQAGSGDPSPENIRPITGWTGANVTRTGKNLYEVNLAYSRANGIEFSKSNGAVTVSGTNSGGNMSSSANFGKVVLKPGSYIFSGNNVYTSKDNGRLVLYKFASMTTTNSSGHFGAVGTDNPEIQFTINNETIVGFASIIPANFTINATYYPMIRLASDTDATFEPYAGENKTVSFPETVYGGTLDVARGLLTVTYQKMIFDGSQTLVDRIANQNRVYIEIPDVALVPTLNDPLSICNRLPKVAPSQTATTPGICIPGNGYAYIQGVTGIDGVTNLTELNAWLEENNVEVTYPLAEPITYQLTPQEIRTLLGVNNLWADCGDVEATYRAGAAAPVLTSADVGVAGGAAAYNDCTAKSSIAPVEATYVATRNYFANEFIIIGSHFYKTTTTISNGTTIVVGTNVVETTIAEQLIALFNSLGG